MDKGDYLLVCKYVDGYGGRVYRYLLRAGLQGFSILYHEAAEIEWYFQHGLDPFGRLERQLQNEEAEKREYAQSHTLGLIAEHRFLQARAEADGPLFHLGELIVWNVGPWDTNFDLRTVQEYVEQYGEELACADELREVRKDLRKQVIAWYRKQGFKRRYP
jgi:hypothetical protein